MDSRIVQCDLICGTIVGFYIFSRQKFRMLVLVLGAVGLDEVQVFSGITLKVSKRTSRTSGSNWTGSVFVLQEGEHVLARVLSATNQTKNQVHIKHINKNQPLTAYFHNVCTNCMLSKVWSQIQTLGINSNRRRLLNLSTYKHLINIHTWYLSFFVRQHIFRPGDCLPKSA